MASYENKQRCVTQDKRYAVNNLCDIWIENTVSTLLLLTQGRGVGDGGRGWGVVDISMILVILVNLRRY